jgi:superfamily II DNA/RNA helicase
MQHSDSYERRRQGSRPPFRRSRNRHPGLAEREPPRQLPKPKGDLPGEFATSVFGLVNPLLQHAVAEEGYLTPTPIQEKAIPHLLEGRDLLGCAQTGTG